MDGISEKSFVFGSAKFKKETEEYWLKITCPHDDCQKMGRIAGVLLQRHNTKKGFHKNIPIPMNTIIVYYSFTNNNEQLAKHLQEKLHCDILKIETVRKRTGLSIMLDLIFGRKPAIRPHEMSMAQYDRFIFVAPVWAGKIASPLKSFLYAENNSIVHYAFITLCGGGQQSQRQKLEAELTAILETPPENVTELWVKDVVEAKTMDTAKFTSAYRIEPKDLEFFAGKIDEFIEHRTALVS
jgi:flavodoxin